MEQHKDSHVLFTDLDKTSVQHEQDQTAISVQLRNTLAFL